MKFLYWDIMLRFCFRKWFATKTADSLHKHTTFGVRKRVPFQQILMPTEKNRDRRLARPHRATGKLKNINVVLTIMKTISTYLNYISIATGEGLVSKPTNETQTTNADQE